MKWRRCCFSPVSPSDVISIQTLPTQSRGSTQHPLSPWLQPLHPPHIPSPGRAAHWSAHFADGRSGQWKGAAVMSARRGVLLLTHRLNKGSYLCERNGSGPTSGSLHVLKSRPPGLFWRVQQPESSWISEKNIHSTLFVLIQRKEEKEKKAPAQIFQLSASVTGSFWTDTKPFDSHLLHRAFQCLLGSFLFGFMPLVWRVPIISSMRLYSVKTPSCPAAGQQMDDKRESMPQLIRHPFRSGNQMWRSKHRYRWIYYIRLKTITHQTLIHLK